MTMVRLQRNWVHKGQLDDDDYPPHHHSEKGSQDYVHSLFHCDDEEEDNDIVHQMYLSDTYWCTCVVLGGTCVVLIGVPVWY